MARIIVDSDIPFVKGVLEPFAEVVYVKGVRIDRTVIRNADVLVVRTRTKCTREMLEGSRVKLICTATIGYDHIDTGYCASVGIRVVNAAGCNARAVLQWVAASLEYISRVKGWKPEDKTLGVVGCGHVGSLVARYADSWGFQVVCCDPPLEEQGQVDPLGRPFVDFESLARDCDIVSFHVPLIRDGKYPTYHMAGNAFFDELRAGALVLNSSRGEVVDTAACRDAVSAGRCDVALDVWEDEPRIDPVLLEKALVSTPHIAGYSAQGKANAAAHCVRTIAETFDLPLNDWYPVGQIPSSVRNISWGELGETITNYFNIHGESQALKASPQDFERMRNSYDYRSEYF